MCCKTRKQDKKRQKGFFFSFFSSSLQTQVCWWGQTLMQGCSQSKFSWSQQTLIEFRSLFCAARIIYIPRRSRRLCGFVCEDTVTFTHKETLSLKQPSQRQRLRKYTSAKALPSFTNLWDVSLLNKSSSHPRPVGLKHEPAHSPDKCWNTERKWNMPSGPADQ